MKKFIVISILIALAGIAIGVVRRQQPDQQATVAAGVTTTTTLAAEPATTSTTARSATKATTKLTTATTARRVTPPTTVAVATTASTSLATTTTTAAPTTTAAGPPPTCTLSQENRAVRLTSNLANTPYKMVVVYPANPNTMNKIPQQFVRQSSTDGAGGDLWSPVPSPSPTTGPGRVSVSFYPAGARSISGLCSTTFV